jgi:hypothetical protein
MKRRKFIQNLFLLSGGLALTGSQAFAYKKNARRKIRGTVSAAGKNLAGVVVSDGYNAVNTNSKGKYELPYNEQSKFVFVSVPAGYDFPAEKKIARHYQRIVKAGKGQYDFDLVPLQKDDTKHNFIIWADPQVKNEKDVQLMLSQSVPDVQQLVATLGAGALIHGIGVGDLVWDNHSLFKRYNEAVAAMNIHFFKALGNHDMDYNKGGDEVSDDTFEDNYGPSYYSFNRGKVHYIVLDDVRYLGKDRDYDGYISKQQLDWLKQDLGFVPKDNLVIISLHIPVHNSVKNNDELYAILEGYKVHIMSGHTHYNRNVVQNGIYEHNHGTVCGAWWTGPVCGDGTPCGYGVYEVNGTELTWYYKSTGLDKEHQLSVHVEELTNQKRLIVNVWNWDPEWKVEWWADEKYLGSLEAVKGFDPLAVQLYKGDKLPERRPFAEPHRTEHLFMAHFSPEVKEVKVLVTDRFGNKFEKSAV